MIRSRVRVSLFLALFLFLFPSRSFSDSPRPVVYPNRSKQLSWKPRAFIHEGFLTGEECDHLISIAKSELKRSAVADNLSGKSKVSNVRTSSGMFISKGKV